MNLSTWQHCKRHLTLHIELSITCHGRKRAACDVIATPHAYRPHSLLLVINELVQGEYAPYQASQVDSRHHVVTFDS